MCSKHRRIRQREKLPEIVALINANGGRLIIQPKRLDGKRYATVQFDSQVGGS
jgi:hypothetical protein